MRQDLENYCINGAGHCYDIPRARDYMRSHACDIYDLLESAYENKINIIEWRDIIATEATDIVLEVWRQMGTLITSDMWGPDVAQALSQHVGRPLNSIPLIKGITETSTSDAPLLAMAKAAAKFALPLESSKSVALQLRELKKESGITYEELRKALRIDITSVQRHISGKLNPRRDKIDLYEKAFTKLLGREIKIKPP